jgi:predicted phosphodiesterase
VRYAVLADIHANLHALEAVLSALEGERIDAHIVAGDLVGYGPLPDECVAAVAGLDAVAVAGNHDLIALGRLDDAGCIALARRSLRWTRETMSAATRAQLEALPGTATAGGEVAVAHGSLDDAREYTTQPEQAVRQLARLDAEHGGARLLVLGHTHRPWACSGSGRVLTPGAGGVLDLREVERCVLNPGAVGQARERRVRARFLVLDTERREAVFHAVPYDVAGCRAALRERGLPPRAYVLRRSLLRGAARVSRGAVRRVRGSG